MSEQSEWENCLSERLSRAGVVEYARALHNDEQGISRLCRILLTTGDTRRAGNAAWILSHLSGEDKRIYLLPFYDELVDMAMRPDLKIRRALLFSLLADLPVTEDFRADLLDYCLCGMTDGKEADSSRSVMIKLVAGVCRVFPELKNELAASLELLSEEMKPSIAAACRQAWKCIGQKP